MKKILEKCLRLNKTERLLKLCELGAKEETNVITAIELLEIIIIQAIRTENGEIDELLKNDKENLYQRGSL